MIEQAKAVAQRLRDCETFECGELEHTIDALVAEVENLNHLLKSYQASLYSAVYECNQLRAEVERLKAKEERYTLVDTALKNEVEEMRQEVERLKDAAEGSPLSEEAMDIAQSEIRRLTGQAFLIAVERDELRMEVERLKQDVPEVGFGNMEQAKPVAWGIIASNTGRIAQVEIDEDEVEGHNPKYIVPLYTAPQDHTALLRQALEALHCSEYDPQIDAAIDAIKEALK